MYFAQIMWKIAQSVNPNTAWTIFFTRNSAVKAFAVNIQETAEYVAVYLPLMR